MISPTAAQRTGPDPGRGPGPGPGPGAGLAAGLFGREPAIEHVRLRTLILLRWMAVGGQLLALAAGHRFFALDLPLGACFLVIGAAVIANLVSIFVFPASKRLSDSEAAAMLLFDLGQLAVLLYLTGGINNPFALLVLAPVVISASALRLRTTIVIGIVAVAVVTLALAMHLPLRFVDGTELAVPPILAFGFWLSLVIGILFLGLYAYRVASEVRSMSQALLATQMALAREQKLTDLGGVVAAAAHELGTPLATIKLVSAELMEELAHDPALREDAQLIRDQADRCRDILRSMGRAGKDDLHLRRAPVGAVVREAAEPHLARGKVVHFDVAPSGTAADRQPTMLRRPETIHGLRNLLQNAVDFARSQVWVDVTWSSDALSITIVDDGDGFPPQLLGRIGDPFVRQRRGDPPDPQRPEYEGMGLGLFIAKTLLERTGARLTFANGTDPFLDATDRPERAGAIVEVIWRLADIAADGAAPLGRNQLLLP